MAGGTDLSVGGGLDVVDAAAFHDDLSIATGGSFNCNGTADFADALAFQGAVDFNQTATFHAGLVIPSGDTAKDERIENDD